MVSKLFPQQREKSLRFSFKMEENKTRYLRIAHPYLRLENEPIARPNTGGMHASFKALSLGVFKRFSSPHM